MSRLNLNTHYYSKPHETIQKTHDEMEQGFHILNTISNPLVSFFGSHRVKTGSQYYEHARKLAQELGEKGYGIISGGGPGIMHAANSGATQAGAPSLGLAAELLSDERIDDPIFTHYHRFRFLFARRFLMAIKSEALIFYPGGLGTLNEVFEYGVLMQTGITDRVPIICVGEKYWKGLFKWMDTQVVKSEYLIDPKDFDLFHLTDEPEKIMQLIHHN